MSYKVQPGSGFVQTRPGGAWPRDPSRQKIRMIFATDGTPFPFTMNSM